MVARAAGAAHRTDPSDPHALVYDEARVSLQMEEEVNVRLCTTLEVIQIPNNAGQYPPLNVYCPFLSSLIDDLMTCRSWEMSLCHAANNVMLQHKLVW